MMLLLMLLWWWWQRRWRASGHAHSPRSRVLEPDIERDELIPPRPRPALTRIQQRLGHAAALVLQADRHRLHVRVPLPGEVVLATRREHEAGARLPSAVQQTLSDEEKIGGKGIVQVSQHDCVVSTVDVLGHTPGGDREVTEAVG